MSKLTWDDAGQRFYETGVKNGVLYVQETAADGTVSYGKGVAWNGLISVTESPSGAEATPLYADDMKYLELRSAEEFGGTIEAYTYPDEFMACDGSASIVDGVTVGQQTRKTFAFCYTTTVGNDTDKNDYGYKIHVVYGATVSPSEKGYNSINDNPEAITFSWEFTTTPTVAEIKSGTYKTAVVTFDSNKIANGKMTEIENKLYGDNSNDAALPSLQELLVLAGAEAKPAA